MRNNTNIPGEIVLYASPEDKRQLFPWGNICR